jgi:5-bromo-4-chloroindolyl phosphate hydrolysis protein
MGHEEEIVAESESDARYANEGLEKSHEYLEPSEPLQIVCECGRQGCGEIITISTAEYEQIRDEPTHFAVAKTHIKPEVERIVRETDQFAVVAKHPGTAAEVSRDEDPRS